jgi:2',3'-cyclic-nucleotide 2'-phosphodiesterase/3'-nucleotidase
MVTAARKWMRVIKQKEHPDLIIGLFHSGKSGGITTSEYEEDASLKVATQVPGFDVVMFGHDHTRDNEMIKNVAGKNVLCIDPANNALTVAEAQIELTYRHGRVIRKNITGNLVDVTKEDVDSAYMDHFKPQIEKINNYVDRIIGNFNNTISTRDCYFGSSAFNDFILNLQLQITNADVAFNAPLQFDASIKAGPVRVADMFNLYRFENQLYVMRMTGEEIRKHLEMSYDLWVNTMKSADDHLLLLSDTRGDAQRLGFKNFTFNFDSAAGIDYVVDVTKPDGEKVKIMCMSNGRHFDENKWYKVALNSYRGNGGGELLTKGAGIPKDSLDSRIIYRSPRDQRYYLMQEIEKMGTVYAKPNNNWKFIPEEWTVPAAKRDSVILFEHKADAKDEK